MKVDIRCGLCEGCGDVPNCNGVMGSCPVCDGRGAVERRLPTVVCLTGSTRFKDAYREAMRSESLKGHVVLTVAFATYEGGSEVTPEQKAMLDDLHLRKIDLSDEILVLNVGGYVGPSTLQEIGYAKALGKGIRYLETPVLEESHG